MGQPRAGKKVIVVSSDEESEGREDILTDNEKLDDKPAAHKDRPAGKVNGKLPAKSQRVPQKSIKDPSPQPPTPSQSQRSKQPATTAPKRAKGTIFSFFNAATQKQQASQRSISPPKPKTSQLDEDVVDTIDEGDGKVHIAQGSGTALAQRKRKLKHNEQYADTDTIGLPSAKQKFRKTVDGSRISSHPVTEDRRPWTEQFAPKDLTELAVHKKKVIDVRNLLTEATSSRARPRLIVLKGAAGTGKTATVRLLAQDLDAELLEWRNPGSTDAGAESFVSASAQFEEFVLRSGKFTGLELAPSHDNGPQMSKSALSSSDNNEEDKQQIILIEEFPNTFTKSSTVLQSFRSTIQRFLSSPTLAHHTPVPIVMVISETLLSTSTAASDSFTAHRLLGPSILTHPYTVELEFNSVAPTYLTKALEQIVVKEARRSGRKRTPGPGVLKRLAETGDIRSAVSSLEFLCLRGDSDIESWGSRVAFTKPKKAASKDAPLTKQEEEALKLVGNRESSLGIFHSVGKVVYNKRIDRPPIPDTQTENKHDASEERSATPPHLLQHRKQKIPETDADTLLTELGTDTSTFVAALHENYVLSCASTMPEEMLGCINGCMDALSDADLLSPDRFGSGSRTYSGSAQDNLRQDELAFQTAVRGLLFALPYPVKRGTSASSGGGSVGGGGGGGSRRSDAFRMFYPTSLKIWKKREEMDSLLELVMTQYSSALDDSRSDEIRVQKKVKGVERWRRNQSHMGQAQPKASGNSQDAEIEHGDGTSLMHLLASQAPKAENLLERLPYLSQILTARNDASTTMGVRNSSSTFAEHVHKLTSLNGIGPSLADEESLDADYEGAEAGADVPGMNEWTDRPDVEDGNDKSKRKRGAGAGTNGRRQGKVETEGGGLNIPVEHEVEKLVLSDDDIVD